MRKRIFLSLLLSAVGLVAGENAGRRAPGFALPDSDLKLHDLADYRGKVILLEFMQTDCDHCAAFVPVLAAVQQKYGDKVAILAVANGQHDDSNKVRQYIAGHKIAYPVLFDQGQMEYSYILKFSADNPYLFLIDPKGVIRNDWGYSPFTKDIFEGKGLFNEIDRVLSAGAPAPPKKKEAPPAAPPPHFRSWTPQ